MRSLRAPRTLRRAADAHTLRRLLVAIAAVFVGCPLVVYHFFTFDFQRVPSTAAISRRFVGRLSPLAQLAGYADEGSNNKTSSISSSNYTARAALYRCLDLPSADFLSLQGVEAIRRQCGADDDGATVRGNDTKPVALNAHFAYVALSDIPRLPGDPPASQDPDERFSFVNVAAVQSVRRVLQPELLVLHYLSRPRGEWFTQSQRYLSLHSVLPPLAFAPPASPGSAPLPLETRRQILQLLLVLRALSRQGGVGFLGFDTILLRPLVAARDAPELLVASQSASELAFSVGLHVLYAPAGHPTLAYLEREILAMIVDADSVLYRQPLEQVVGQLVREQLAAGGGPNGVAVGSPALFELSDEEVDQLLAPATDSADVRALHAIRESVAFSIPRASVSSREAVARLHHDRASADEWLALDSVFGAVLRFAMGTNSTDELGL